MPAVSNPKFPYCGLGAGGGAGSAGITSIGGAAAGGGAGWAAQPASAVVARIIAIERTMETPLTLKGPYVAPGHQSRQRQSTTALDRPANDAGETRPARARRRWR